MGTLRAEVSTGRLDLSQLEMLCSREGRGSLGLGHLSDCAGPSGSWSWCNRGPEATLVDTGPQGLCSPTCPAVESELPVELALLCGVEHRRP